MPDGPRFWVWLRDYAKRRVQAAYMDAAHHDRKCPICSTWLSETWGCAEFKDEGEDRAFQLMRCKQCGHWSRWDMRYGPVVPLADEQPQIHPPPRRT